MEDLLSSEVDLQKVCIFAGGEYPRTRLGGCSVFTGMHRLLTCRIPRLVTRLLEPKRIVSCGLGWTTGTGQINDHARSENSSLALYPPFTQNRCHFGRCDFNKIFPPLQEQSCRSDPYSMHILGAPGDEMLLTKTCISEATKNHNKWRCKQKVK